jgi:hypothetical protein
MALSQSGEESSKNGTLISAGDNRVLPWDLFRLQIEDDFKAAGEILGVSTSLPLYLLTGHINLVAVVTEEVHTEKTVGQFLWAGSGHDGHFQGGL